MFTIPLKNNAAAQIFRVFNGELDVGNVSRIRWKYNTLLSYHVCAYLTSVELAVPILAQTSELILIGLPENKLSL